MQKPLDKYFQKASYKHHGLVLLYSSNIRKLDGAQRAQTSAKVSNVSQK